MGKSYAKIIVKGSPITKSNFKLSNIHGRAILPYNSGKYHDRYAVYEEQIAYEAKSQNPDTVITESVIAILKVYYKSSKRHPDTTNITKSIFDGVEKSGIIINDAQVRKLVIEEYYDKENPRFELELFGESQYNMNFEITKKEVLDEPIEYTPPCNKKRTAIPIINKKNNNKLKDNNNYICEICGKAVKKENSISINNGKSIICKSCLNKLF